VPPQNQLSYCHAPDPANALLHHQEMANSAVLRKARLYHCTVKVGDAEYAELFSAELSFTLAVETLTYLLSQLLVFGLQILAMATPGCIKLYQDIFVFCINNFIKVLSNHHLKV